MNDVNMPEEWQKQGKASEYAAWEGVGHNVAILSCWALHKIMPHEMACIVS